MKSVNKIIILLSFICSSYLIASNIESVKDFSKYPLSKDATSISRGGSISDKIASEDGVGTILIGGVGNDSTDINNKIYNQTLKSNKDILSDTTNLKDININNSDLNKINENIFVKLNNVNGTPCNDNNPLTVGETYLNDKCQGGTLLHSDGESCDDGNTQTINDKYINGICKGTNVEGQSCNDNNVQTINDKYINGVCVGTNVEGQSCNDNNSQTINDKYVNGICIGTDSLTNYITPSQITFKMVNNSTRILNIGSGFATAQTNSGYVDGGLSTSILLENDPIYMEFLNNGYATGVYIGETHPYQSSSNGFNSYIVSGTVSVFYNPESGKTAVCNNGISCKIIILGKNSSLGLMLGSGTGQAGSIFYINKSSHNSTYVLNAYNATK